jgi:hypothetical protein
VLLACCKDARQPTLFYKTVQSYEKNMVAASDFSYFFLLFAQIVVILHAVQSILRLKTRKIICQNIMGFLSKLFGKKQDEKKAGGIEDYMMLVRVYFQSAIASQLGINNLAMLPDLRMFKATLKVPTQNNKLGVGEKAFCKKMMKEVYNVDDGFFKEIDQSVRKNCNKLQDAQTYLVQFQGFSQDLMMLMGNLMKFKLRLPSFFKSAIYQMTEKTVNDIFNKNDYKDAGVMKTVVAIRQYDKRLGFSQKWVTDFVYQVVMLAKKEPKKKEENA